MAEILGVASRTYANYERNERVPDADALIRLVRAGWNANWLLTGEGPERLDQLLDPVASGVAAAEWSSNPRQMEALALALEEVDRMQVNQRARWSPQRRAKAVVLIAEILADPSDELPKADIVSLTRRLGDESAE